MSRHFTNLTGSTLVFSICLALVIGFCLALTGCSQSPSQEQATTPTPVAVSHPVERYVTDYADFTARTAAVDSVEVRARVWGYLDRVNFKEGALVQKGDVLFEIDPQTYEAALNQAKAKVALDEAQLKYNESDYRRNSYLAARGAVSTDDLEKARAARDVAAATVGADRANMERNRLDLDYTKIKAPISGRVSRMYVTAGNLVQSGDQGGGTLLTTLVSVDPMYAYFDVDEGSVLRVRKLIREGKVRSARDVEVPVLLGLANEDGFPHRGTINFVDNQVNAKTGTLRLRGVFPNKDESLAPGYFGRVRVQIGQPHRALLINDRAIDTDQGQKIVYVVDDKNEVFTRVVQPGALHDGLRAVDGLKPDDRVIVTGLQQIRPGMSVGPKLEEMPNGNLRTEVRTQVAEVRR
jgi:RND family efflux transporter MFP subunit